MRHLKAGRRLGVTTSHRRAMMRNLVTSLIENEQITCTLARAKELRKPLDKMITYGKKGDLHSRRQALKFIKTKEAMAALFGDLAERFKDRQGGYSRIIKLAKKRLGDGAEMVLIQLIGGPNDVLSDLKNKSSKKKAKPKSNSVLEDVSKEINKEKKSEVTSVNTEASTPPEIEKVEETPVEENTDSKSSEETTEDSKKEDTEEFSKKE